MRFAHAHLSVRFPYLPERPGYDERLRAALPLAERMIQAPATDILRWPLRLA
jgi:hypothetical protein